MLRLLIFLILSGLSGLTGWATGWGLYKGYWLVTEVKFVTNQTNYITDSYECQRANTKEAQLRLTLKELNDQTWDVLLSIMAFPSHESVGNDLRRVLDLVINLLNVHRGHSLNSKTEENQLRLGLADVKDAAWES